MRYPRINFPASRTINAPTMAASSSGYGAGEGYSNETGIGFGNGVSNSGNINGVDYSDSSGNLRGCEVDNSFGNGQMSIRGYGG